ncbi:MAG: hypothetical protein KDD98_08410 [Sphingomonadaceae bacterium]|nr:hypothetical protein [Sphingomonadaceae bacterium]
MSNNQAAEAIRAMDRGQQQQVKKGLLGLVFNSLAVLALIGAVGVFLTMQEEESERATYLDEGTVSRALLLSTSVDEYKLANKRGQTVDASKNFVRIAHDPESSVKYSDLGTNVQESDLPAPPGKDYTASIDMDDEEFAGIKAGDVLTVVTTPYDRGSPWTLAKLRNYSPDGYYLWMGIFAALAIALWFAGRVMSRR